MLSFGAKRAALARQDDHQGRGQDRRRPGLPDDAGRRGIEPRASGQGADLIGRRPVPIHRSDLARNGPCPCRHARFRQGRGGPADGRRRSRADRRGQALVAARSQAGSVFSALMAGELINDIQQELQSEGERELAEAELYLAHFFGAKAAVQFLRALDEQPDAVAAKLFPKAARANLGLFSEKKGRKRRSLTVAELYDRIDGKIIRRRAATTPRRSNRSSRRSPARSEHPRRGSDVRRRLVGRSVIPASRRRRKGPSPAQG